MERVFRHFQEELDALKDRLLAMGGLAEERVRESVRGVIDGFGELTDRHFLYARQENLETIHQHNVVAERFGLLGEIRREEASGEHSDRHVSTREWLDGRA